MKKTWAWQFISSFLLGTGLLFVLSTFSLAAQEPSAMEVTDLSPGKWLLTQDAQDPFLRLRYFPTVGSRILTNSPDGSASSRLKRAFNDQVAPYFQADPKRLDRIGTMLTFWSADMHKNFWGDEHYDLPTLKDHFKNRSSLTVKEMTIMQWAWMRLGLDELNRPADKRSQLWLASFFGNLERRYSDARILLEVDPFYSVKAFEYMNEFWNTCQAEYNKGERSKRFLRLGEIFSRYRDQSFAGSTLDWKRFEENLVEVSFEKLRIDEIAFLIVLYRLENDQRLTDGVPWGRSERERILSLANENKIWGILSDVPVGEEGSLAPKEEIASWSKPEAERKYRESKIDLKTKNLNPVQWVAQQPYAAVALGIGLGMRRVAKPLRNLAKMRGPIPMDLLERQMAENPRGTVAHEEARLHARAQEAQKRAAVQNAEARYGNGAAMEAYLDQRAEARRHLIQTRMMACSIALMASVEAGASVLQSRREALNTITASKMARSATASPVPSFKEFAKKELGVSHRYQRWTLKYWRQRRLANRFGMIGQKRFISNPPLSGGERFSAMIPGQNLRLSLAESTFSRIGTALSVGGAITLGLQGIANGSDYFWGAEEPDFQAIAEGTPDLLWNQTLANRSATSDRVKELQLNPLISQLEDLKKAWNVEDENSLAIPESVKIEVVADLRSGSEPDPETGRVLTFFALIYQNVPGSDPINLYVNQLNGYVLRFASNWDSKSSPDIRKAGQVGWKLTGIQALEGASLNSRRQAALALRSDGVDYWLDPETAEILFVGN